MPMPSPAAAEYVRAACNSGTIRQNTKALHAAAALHARTQQARGQAGAFWTDPACPHDRVGEACVCLAHARAYPATRTHRAEAGTRTCMSVLPRRLRPAALRARVWNHGTSAPGGREHDNPRKSSAPAGSRRR